MTDTNKEREAFEAWLPKAWSRATVTDSEGDTNYADEWVQGAFVGFCAGRASLSAEAEPVAWVDGFELSQIGHNDFEPTVSNAPVSEHDVPLYLAAPAQAPAPGMQPAWQPMDTAPMSGMILLAVEDSSGVRRVFAAEASNEDGEWRWIITTGWIGWVPLQSGWTPVSWRRWVDAPEAAPAQPAAAPSSGKGG